MFPRRRTGESDSNKSLLESTQNNTLYSRYQKLTPTSKVALCSTFVFMVTGVAVGLTILIRMKLQAEHKGHSISVKKYELTLDGGPDVCGVLVNASSNAMVYGLNNTVWEPITSLQINQANVSTMFQWASYYTPSANFTEGITEIICKDMDRGCNLNGVGYMIETSRGYNITFSQNATCDQYELYMESTNVDNMVCRSKGSPVKSELEPYEVGQGKYFNLTFSNHRVVDKSIKSDTEAIGDIDCYSPYGYTINRVEVDCNRSDSCSIAPRVGGYTCEGDMFVWPTTTECRKVVYLYDCPLNNTNSTDDDYYGNGTDDDLNTTSVWIKRWQRPKIGRESFTLFTLPQGVVPQEEKDGNHLRRVLV